MLIQKRLTNCYKHLLVACHLYLLFTWILAPPRAEAQGSTADRLSFIHEVCPRYAPGNDLLEHHQLISARGLLRVNLSMRSSLDPQGNRRFCYVDDHGNVAPTLRVRPGDTLLIHLSNQTTGTKSASMRTAKSHDPCAGGRMTVFSTNLHFHGLSVPPICHQDETLRTIIEPGDFPFEYRIKIPRNQPPGLYWYHPHIHGFSEAQILGGASGAIIVEGIERTHPMVAALPQRVLVVRDELMPDPTRAEQLDPNRPTKQLSVNYVSVPYPKYPPAVLRIRPSERQFFRVLNASADTYLDLAFELNGKPQPLDIVALDGVPLRYNGSNAHNYSVQQSHVFLPPAGRAEFIITGPPLGSSALLMTNYVYRGAADDDGRPVPVMKTEPAVRSGQDDVDPRRPLAILLPSTGAPEPSGPRFSASTEEQARFAPLTSVRPVRKRILYFSEKLQDPGDPKSATLFFITEDGHPRMTFNPDSIESAIVVHQGDVEDWVIENRSQELHSFHVHQLHFMLLGGQGIPWEEPALRDTVNLPAWDGFRKYPKITLRMDFRDRAIAGIIPFHCHVTQHIDGGMMGIIRVEPYSTIPDK